MTLNVLNFVSKMDLVTASRSRTAATFNMESFVIIVNGWKLLTIITKRSILDVAAALGPLLVTFTLRWFFLLFLRFIVEITLFKIVGKIYRLSCLY